MTITDVLAVIDARLDQIEADSRRRFASLALADAPDLDVDALDALLDQNAADWQTARDRAHRIITRALDAPSREDR